ncbi:hypothetical protein NLJ89_g1717 [Agrocybe chaxingu]|uniref:Uncharacterized protein n=1 Tax=Agrocybe chaxingu TaxID=84603 RepID=A0A9W8MZI1_9AGAR|nr:hypothetical protein NLJ89_g1717 [Agrocybe chaxingu]
MPLLANIIGFSFFGLAARIGQLSIQRRNMFSNPGGHLLSMGAFGFVGYWAYKWEVYSTALLVEKRQAIVEGRLKALRETDEAAGGAILGDRVIEACEEVTVIEQRVQELQDRVSQLMVVIVDSVIVQDDNTTGVVQAAAGDIEVDVKALSKNLVEIVNDLEEIKIQNRWMLLVFKDANKSRIDDCMGRLSTALERFSVAQGLRVADILNRIQARLERIQSLTENVAHRVQDLNAKVDDRFDEIMATLKHAQSQNASAALMRKSMPSKPRIFHGRDELIGEIPSLLVDDATSRKQYRLVQIMHSNLRIMQDTKSPLEDILNELGSSKQPRLILFDNFETPWNLMDGTQKEVGDILARVAALEHIAILVTMRGTHPPAAGVKWQQRNIPPPDEEACCRIYKDINLHTTDEANLSALLRAVGCIPFGVVLMANLAAETGASPQELLEEWINTGTNMLSTSNTPESSMNTSISLSVDSNLIKQGPDAHTLLAILSMLPAGTSKDNLKWWAPTLKSRLGAISTLSKAALLMSSQKEEKSVRLVILPVVQSYMHRTNRVSDDIRQQVRHACCKLVLEHATRSGQPEFQEKSAILAAEERNIQSLLFPSHDSNNSPVNQSWISLTGEEALRALIAFSWYRNDTMPSMEIATHTLEICQSATAKDIAEATFCLGSTCHRLNLFALAKKYLQAARTSFLQLPSDPDSLSKAAECGLALAKTMNFLDEGHWDIMSLILNAYQEFESCGNNHGCACTLVEKGAAYWAVGNLEEALNSLEAAKEAFERLNHPAGICQTLGWISRVHFSWGHNEEALENAKEALKMAGLVGDGYLLANLLQYTARPAQLLNQIEDALKYFEQSLLMYESQNIPLGIAQVLEGFGYLYLQQRNFRAAQTAYDAAMQAYVCLRLLPDAQPLPYVQHGEVRCSSNLAKLKEKDQGNCSETGFAIPEFYLTKVKTEQIEYM